MDCPSDTCDVTTECDACLDAHLRQAHNTTYETVYGQAPNTWMSVCTRHARISAQRMGGIEPITTAPTPLLEA